MLSLVNYGSSDSENNISDEEEVVIASKVQQNGKNKEIEVLEENSQDTESTIIKLPKPINQARPNQAIEEEDDEFLHKKEVAEVVPPPKVKQKVKITIPKLSDFKDEDDDITDTGPKYPTASNRKTGLLNMLPKPAHSSVPANKPTPSVPLKPPQTVQKNVPQQTVDTNQPQTSIDSSSNSQDSKKKIGFIPYALMDHKKTADENKKSSKRKSQESDDSGDEEAGSSFFSFNSKDEDLPKVSEDEIKAMIAKETNRLEERKKQAEQSEEMEYEEQDYSQYHQEQQQESIDAEAIKALVGGSKAKRSKMEDIQIVDLSDRDVLPDKDEWIRKNLAGETSFLATGKIDEKGPSALAKRKHQISYLSMRAEKNMSELEAMWAANRQTNREGRSKYGF